MKEDHELKNLKNENIKNNKDSIFPWKMIIHILLVVLTTTQAILIISSNTSYTRAQERLFYNMFIVDSDKTDIDYKRFIYLYSVKDLKNHLSTSVTNFYSLKENSLETVLYVEDYPKVVMEVNYIDNNLINKQKYFATTQFITQHNIKREFIYQISNITLGPFDYPDSDIKDFLNDIVEFKVNYNFRTYVPVFYFNNYECYLWSINQNYNFQNRGHFITKILINRSPCEGSSISLYEHFVNELMWIHILTLFFAIISLVGTWRYIYKIAILYGKVKDDYKKKKKNVEKQDIYISGSKDSEYYNPLLDKNRDLLSEPELEENNKNKKGHFPHPQEKKKLLNGWSIICLCGNVVQIFGSCLSMLDNDNVFTGTEILVGFGCMLAFINIGRYLDSFSDYSTLTETLKRSLPNVLRYLFGVMPIFFGFLFFGLCLFWRSERFNNSSTTMITLFALLNGDSIFDTFNDLSGFSFFLGQIYCYMFCLMFLVVVLNVFIAIIEEAYITIRMTNRNHWIYAYLKLNDTDRRLEMKEEKYDVKSTVALPHLEKSKFSFQNEKFNPKSLKNANLDQSKPEKKLNNEVISMEISKHIKNLDNYDPYLKDNKNYEKSKNDLEKGLENIFNQVESNFLDIIRLSEDIRKLKDPELKNDLMEFIFDHNNIIDTKINIIREILIKK